jgi:CNT family concentrative nucleoside transporter
MAFAMINLPVIVSFFEYLAGGILKMGAATLEGTKFAFGYVGGGAAPFEPKDGGSAFVFAFQALPNVILSGALAAILTYLKVLPLVTKTVGYAFKAVFKVREPIGMVAAAKIFLGQCEAPLLIKRYIGSLDRSEIFIILSLAFSTAAASVMPIYAGCLSDICGDSMRHIVMSSVLGVISTMLVCSVMMPGDSRTTAKEFGKRTGEEEYGSFMEAMSRGISDGAFVWWCIVGSLIGTIALLAMFNCILGTLPSIGEAPITLQRIFGAIMYPFAWLLGIRDQDMLAVSQVLGTKLAVNETVAFFDLAKAGVSQGSAMRAIYAIMNFGNFSAIGITVGAMAAIAPSQRKAVTDTIWRAFVAGFLATGLSSFAMSAFFFLKGI